ncbi:MAG: ABC transporter permease subunit [Thermoplasmata archaeon]
MIPWAMLASAGPLLAVSLLPIAGSVGGELPEAAVDLAASFTRMLLAYLLALGFCLIYGYYAATHRPAERVLIPVLDVLQSIPILGFFPIALVVFVGLTGPHSLVGPNLASIFLIFTSMAWNMVFGVYESIKSMPQELREAADSFGVRGLQRLRTVVFPATVNRLVYNSILSWTAGWYFLVAAEIISVSNQTTVLPGIGSFLLTAAGSHNESALLTGLGLLIVLIALLDLALWRPLIRWAERFRYDQSPSGSTEGAVYRRAGGQPLRRAAVVVVRYVRTGVTRVSTPIVALSSSITERARRGREPGFGRTAAKTVALGTVLTLSWLLLITLGVAVYGVFHEPITGPVHNDLLSLPEALGLSFGRVVLAYLLSLAIAFPLALAVTRRTAAGGAGLSLIEIVASVPATALFPLFIFALLPYLGFQGAAILMLTTGMLWYLFFNLLSGLRSIPPDLKEAARSFGLRRREYYRRLLLPAVFPAFVTGSITAFGGGWNTLVIAEYLHYSPTQHFQVLGLGELINVGIQLQNGTGLPLMVAALLVMVLTVVALNELLWKPLYRRASDRYRID